MTGNPSKPSLGLHRFAVVAALATFCLIWIGGLVTSKGAGMAVPDWPTTYGYNMFLFPISQWTGGIFYEHSHRLLASFVGLLTVILAVWLWVRDGRSWVRNCGLLAVFLVIGQGILGGLRVAAMKDELGIFHATLAQLFFILMSGLAVVTSPRWHQASRPVALRESKGLQWWLGGLFFVVLAQLMIAASMRHQHAGLAIPDFPAAYGGIWPATDAESIARYNQSRGEVTALNPITAAQVHLQMVHRVVAVVILAIATGMWLFFRRRLAAVPIVRRALWILMLMVWIQAGLGAATIWTNKAADVATAHVALGALTFSVTAMSYVVARRLTVAPALAALEGRVAPSPVMNGNAAQA